MAFTKPLGKLVIRLIAKSQYWFYESIPKYNFIIPDSRRPTAPV